MERYIMLDIQKLPEGCYLATSSDIQGLVAQGKTFEETIEIAKDLATQLIELQQNKSQKNIEKIIYPMLINI